MGVFVDLTSIREVKIEDVTFRLRPLSGEEMDSLQDEAGQFVMEGTSERFKTNLATMKTLQIFKSLSGAGAGWDAKDKEGKEVSVTKEAVKNLNPSVRDKLSEEIASFNRLSKEQEKNL